MIYPHNNRKDRLWYVCRQYHDFFLQHVPQDLQSKLNALVKYCEDLGMKVNINEKLIIFVKAQGELL